MEMMMAKMNIRTAQNVGFASYNEIICALDYFLVVSLD